MHCRTDSSCHTGCVPGESVTSGGLRFRRFGTHRLGGLNRMSRAVTRVHAHPGSSCIRSGQLLPDAPASANAGAVGGDQSGHARTGPRAAGIGSFAMLCPPYEPDGCNGLLLHLRDLDGVKSNTYELSIAPTAITVDLLDWPGWLAKPARFLHQSRRRPE